MLVLFTDLARDINPDMADQLGRTLMLLHEGALVAHGLNILADPISHASDQFRSHSGRLVLDGEIRRRCPDRRVSVQLPES